MKLSRRDGERMLDRKNLANTYQIELIEDEDNFERITDKLLDCGNKMQL